MVPRPPRGPRTPQSTTATFLLPSLCQHPIFLLGDISTVFKTGALFITISSTSYGENFYSLVPIQTHVQPGLLALEGLICRVS